MRTVTLSVLAFFPAGIALADEREHREHAPAIKLRVAMQRLVNDSRLTE